ncbi:MAG: hypothetical protein IPI42_06550 [Saprospiraceae bacterium]|nr:hypothetical protein [Candidatus Parvibacillus calidus]
MPTVLPMMNASWMGVLNTRWLPNCSPSEMPQEIHLPTGTYIPAMKDTTSVFQHESFSDGEYSAIHHVLDSIILAVPLPCSSVMGVGAKICTGLQALGLRYCLPARIVV